MKCAKCGNETGGLYTIDNVLTALCSKCYYIKWNGRKKKKTTGTSSSFNIVSCKKCGDNYKTNDENDNGICIDCEKENKMKN